MPNSHHFMYLNVGCVRVRVSVTEAGRDLFMHNKSIWLIIKGVWDLFPLFSKLKRQNTRVVLKGRSLTLSREN